MNLLYCRILAEGLTWKAQLNRLQADASRLEPSRRSLATPAAVFSLLKNNDTWPRWSLFNLYLKLERAGKDERLGVGAIRTFSTRVSKTREQVTELIPDQKLSYVLLSGLPLRNYQAVVQLSSPESGITLISWTASFQCSYGTGWFWRIFMN